MIRYRTKAVNFVNNYFHEITLFLVLTFGSLIRIRLVTRADLPLNDGGMFYSITDQIVRSNFSFPHYINYNISEIPFAYPPLGFYIMAVVQSVTQIELLVLFKYVPLLFALIILPLYYILSRLLFDDKAKALLSLVIFSTIPLGFIWFIMGGGLTRGIGCIFALLSIIFLMYYFKNKYRSFVVISVVCLSLTFLSHLIWSLFAVIVLAVIIVCAKNHLREKVQMALIYSLGLCLIVGPWILQVTAHHGLQPFVYVLTTSGESAGLYSFFSFENYIREPFPQIITVTAFGGFYVSILRKRYDLVILALCVLVFGGRGVPHMLPFVYPLLASYCVIEFLVPSLGKRTALQKSHINIISATKIHALLIAAIFLLHGILWIKNLLDSDYVYLKGINTKHLEVFDWIRSHTRTDDEFIIISGDENSSWAAEFVAEWFPALAHRKSLYTVQATEWTADFSEKKQQYSHLKQCQDIECINNDTATYMLVTDLKTNKIYKNRSPLQPVYKVVYEDSENVVLKLD